MNCGDADGMDAARNPSLVRSFSTDNMTLRQALGGDARRLHELLETLLDREDAVVVLFDGDRAVSYINGFGLSPSQHEFLALEIEQTMRSAGAAGVSRPTELRTEHDRRDELEHAA